MKVLVINCGSSSIKYKLFRLPDGKPVSGGVIEHIGEAGSPVADHYSGLKTIIEGARDVELIGHRVVHGGEKFKKPALVNKAVIAKIRQCSAIAPLHNPANLSGITACSKLLPGVKQVAVFDTAFHQSLPDYAFIYGLPYDYYRKFGIRKYGFHGTSHEYVAHEAAKKLGKPLSRLKLVTCHLGNGCSITAVKAGKSVDTSMGFTPLEGLLMGTRCGDLDPALVTYIMRKCNLSIHQIEEILNKQSGLKGISGVSNDMRLLDSRAKAGDARSKLAIKVFVYRIKKYIGAYAAAMGGLDAVIFTAGIGQNQASVREAVCKDLSGLFRKKPRVLVVPTDEELAIARQAYHLVAGPKPVK